MKKEKKGKKGLFLKNGFNNIGVLGNLIFYGPTF